MDQVKALLETGEVSADDLKTLLTCKACNCDAPTFDQQTKDQRSDAWLKARSGRVTASDCAAVCVSSLMLVVTDSVCLCVALLTGLLCGDFLVGRVAV